MNELQIFNNPKFGEVRTAVEPDGKVLFCGTDIARALGYAKPRDAILCHCRGAVKRGGVSKTKNQYGIETEQTVQMNFIPEGDIYRLAARSQLPGAEEFESWIFDEVLPSLRHTGTYTVQPITPAELQLAQAKIIVDMEKRIDTVETMLLDVGARADKAVEKVEKAIQVYAKPDKDHWADDMTVAIRGIIAVNGWAESKFRGKLYEELERATHKNINTRLTNLRKRMRKAGMTYQASMKITKLDAIAANGDLRMIFEGIVKRYQAEIAAAG